MKLIFLLPLFFYIPILYGEVYKTVDEDGNIIFSDRPSSNSEEIKLQELKTTETIKPSTSSSSRKSRGENEEDLSYKKLFVSNPVDGSSIRRIFGCAIRARAIASICCSPPERVPASCFRRSSRGGNR